MKQARTAIACTLASTLLAGCVSVRVGTDSDPSHVRMDGLATGYATVGAFPDYDGTILKAGALGHADRDGELVALDVWPIGGVGIGLVGLRLRVLPVEVALGTLFYHPHPEDGDDDEDEEEDEEDEAEEEEDHDEDHDH